MAYISHNYDCKYRYFIYKNRSVFCKFIDGNCYEFGDFWVDRNGYAHLIKNSGGKIYICKYEKIEERYRRRKEIRCKIILEILQYIKKQIIKIGTLLLEGNK